MRASEVVGHEGMQSGDIEADDGGATCARPWILAWADHSTGTVQVPYTVQQAMSYGPFPYDG